jgi:hypothetical protein
MINDAGKHEVKGEGFVSAGGHPRPEPQGRRT